VQKRGSSEKDVRKERRAQALRRNLQRRKLQQRGRASGEAGKADGPQHGR